MANRIGPLENRLLAALPAAEWRRWRPLLEAVDLPMGAVLNESAGTLSHVYFPTTAVVSLLNARGDGASAEIAVVGKEGLIGASLFVGTASNADQAVVQCAGSAYRLSAKRAKAEFSASTSVQHLLLRYTQALITQMAQTAACTQQHSVVQQFCRWLLLSLDRLGGKELPITQAMVAGLLGVAPQGISTAETRLQDLQLICCAPERIAVLNRAGLERQSCECYAVVKAEYGRLLSEQPTG